MKIQADATITYCTYCLLPPNGPFDESFKYYYNTYRCKGLPAGPICNPGANALRRRESGKKTTIFTLSRKAASTITRKHWMNTRQNSKNSA
jgi:cell division protein YceG involved in septum cleavage